VVGATLRGEVDWIGPVTAIAAVIIAALGVMAALLSTAVEMYQERLSREADFYRKITPFLSFEIHGTASGDPPVIDVYADGGGYAFNVLANIVQTNASTGAGGTLVGQNVIRYLRDGPPKLISFMPRAAEGFAGEMRVTFIDTFGGQHEAHQAVRIVAGDNLDTTDAIRWACDPEKCRVHVIRPVPPPGWLTRLAQRLGL